MINLPLNAEIFEERLILIGSRIEKECREGKYDERQNAAGYVVGQRGGNVVDECGCSEGRLQDIDYDNGCGGQK